MVKSTGIKSNRNQTKRVPCVWMTTQIAKFHGINNDPRVCLSWAIRRLPLIGHTGVCNNFPYGTHEFCLSKYPHGIHMKPMCACHLYCPCWANVWLPLWGHTWAAINGAHWSMQQFSTWYPCVLPLKVPIWDPHKTHVCLPSALPMLDPNVITFCEANVANVLERPCVLSLETPTSQVIKMVNPAGVQW